MNPPPINPGDAVLIWRRVGDVKKAAISGEGRVAERNRSFARVTCPSSREEPALNEWMPVNAPRAGLIPVANRVKKR